MVEHHRVQRAGGKTCPVNVIHRGVGGDAAVESNILCFAPDVLYSLVSPSKDRLTVPLCSWARVTPPTHLRTCHPVSGQNLLSVPELRGPQVSYVYLALMEVSVFSPQPEGRVLHIDTSEGAACVSYEHGTVPWKAAPAAALGRVVLTAHRENKPQITGLQSPR